MKKARYQDAYASFRRLRNTELQPARDLYYVHRQLMEGCAVLCAVKYFTRFFELFTIPRVRRALLAAFIIMIAQQVIYSFHYFVVMLMRYPDVWYGHSPLWKTGKAGIPLPYGMTDGPGELPYEFESESSRLQ
jgi:hypothetical protein